MFQGLKEKVEYTKNISNEKINILDKLNFKSLVGSFKNVKITEDRNWILKGQMI